MGGGGGRLASLENVLFSFCLSTIPIFRKKLQYSNNTENLLLFHQLKRFIIYLSSTQLTP